MKLSSICWTALLVLLMSGLVACQTPVAPDDTTDPTSPPPTRRSVEPEPRTDPPPVRRRTDPPPVRRPSEPVVKSIPPRSFRNHWDSAKAKPAKRVDMNPYVARNLRRLSLLQLRTSIPRLFPGFTWKRGNINYFDRYALTLGRADYLSLMTNNNSVTKLFMKFMDDMAMNVCKYAIPADYKKALDQRAFVRYPDDINKNLRWLRMKFHNIVVPETSTKEIAKLRVLFDKVKNYSKDQTKAWELVCVAVLTSPEFYVY
jgi:hypothetical protein